MKPPPSMIDAAAAHRRIIGIDCATEGAKTGLVLAVLDNGELRIDQATVGRHRCPRSIVLEWLTDSDDATLLAIDAPLGWPEPLVTSLTSHTAGARIAGRPGAQPPRLADLSRRNLYATWRPTHQVGDSDVKPTSCNPQHPVRRDPARAAVLPRTREPSRTNVPIAVC